VTAPTPERKLPVEARGHLRLDAPSGRTLGLVADGETLRLNVPGWRDLVAVVPRSARFRGQSIRALGNVLSTCDLALSVESAGSVVCRVGRNVRRNWIARLLGLAPARIPVTAVRLLFKR